MNRTDLVHTLDLVAPALSNTTLVPIFTHFMFTKEQVSAYNDSLAISGKIEKIDEGFSVSGMTLLNLLKNTQVEGVDITLEKEHVLVKAGRSTFKLPFMTTEDFVFEVPNEKWDVTLPLNEDVLKGIGVCITTVSREETYRALMGVCLTLEKDSTLYSCDSDAITRYTLDAKAKGTGRHMLPNAFCDALLKIAKETDTAQGEIKVNDNWACAVLNNGFTIYGRQVERQDEPLDYAKMLADTLTGKTAYVGTPEGLADAVARARVVADPETATTALAVTGGKLKLLTEAHAGTVRDEITMKGHADVDAAVHASLMARSLDVCNEIAIRDNCTAYKLDDKILQVVANVGE